ncbi:MAG: PEP-CTERM sorting domain-containing protein [Gemmatimonas sp.]
MQKNLNHPGNGRRRSLVAVLAVVALAAGAARADAQPTNYFPPCVGACSQPGGDPGGGSQRDTIVAGGVTIPNPPQYTETLRKPGVTAFGSTSWAYFPCATLACDGTGAELSQSSIGGPGVTRATTSFFGNAPGSAAGAFQQYFAEASVEGALGTAVLRASAASQETLGTAPGYSSDCCFYYNSNAIANVMQYYAFTGTTAETFTIQYTLDAILLAYFDSEVDYRPNASVNGGIAFWDGVTTPELELELPLGSLIGIDQKVLDGTMTDINGFAAYTGSVTLTLQPGSGFFMSSLVIASAPQLPGWIVADAAHTMKTSFTMGNTSLLTATLPGTVTPQAVVPEPGTYAMLGFGLLGLGIAARRRVRSA